MRSMRSLSLRGLNALALAASALSCFVIGLVVLSAARLEPGSVLAGAAVAAACAAVFVALHPSSIGRARGLFSILVASALVGAAAGRPVTHGIAVGVTLGLLPGGLAALAIRATLAGRARVRVDGALDAVEQIALWPSVLATVGGSIAWGLGAPAAAVGACLGIGLAGLGAVVVRDARRARWLQRVEQGLAPGLELVTELERDTTDFVPPVTSTPLMDAFVVESHGAGTYRGGGVRPVLRCHATLSRSLAPARARFAAAAVAGCVALPMLAAGAMARARLEAPKVAPSSDVSTPTCAEARAFFSDRAQHEIVGVGAVVLLTHELDPAIAPGDGTMVIAPKTAAPLSPETRRAVEHVAATIPCRDKLHLTVVEATYVPVALEVKLTLDGSRTADAVRAEGEELIRSLFAPEGRGEPDHVDFGAVDRTVGWKLIYALKQVPGVADVALKVDGQTHDRALAPGEMPTLGSLVLRD